MVGLSLGNFHQRKMDVPPFSFHDLRHAHSTMMLEADTSIKILQERLGHADIGTTLNTYGRVSKMLED